MSHTPDPEPPPLVDFGGVPRRLRTVAGTMVVLALIGCVVDGVINGLTFALMGQWVGILVLGVLGASAVTTALHALGGADRAGKRGERLSSADVGIAPRRFQPVPESDAEPADATPSEPRTTDAAGAGPEESDPSRSGPDSVDQVPSGRD